MEANDKTARIVELARLIQDRRDRHSRHGEHVSFGDTAEYYDFQAEKAEMIADIILGHDFTPTLPTEIQPLHSVIDGYIASAIRSCNGSREEAARLLRISSRTVWNHFPAGTI